MLLAAFSKRTGKGISQCFGEQSWLVWIYFQPWPQNGKGSIGLQVLAGITTMANNIMKLLTSLVEIFSLIIVLPSVNRPEYTRLKGGDKIIFHDNGVVRWIGFFLQGECKNDQTSSFLSAAVSRKSCKRIDYFRCDPENQKIDLQNFLPWNVKDGLKYIIPQNKMSISILATTNASQLSASFPELQERCQQRMWNMRVKDLTYYYFILLLN